MARTASIGIRVEPELKAHAEAAAKEDGRTLAQWIERLIVSAVGKPAVATSKSDEPGLKLREPVK